MDRLAEMIPVFGQSLQETVIMVGFSLFIATLIGIPLGILLVITQGNHLFPNKWIYHTLNTVINIVRSLPFIILMVAIIPFTELVVGTSIGIEGAIVPLHDVDRGVIEAYQAMGASRTQIIFRIMLREARPGIVLCLTIATIGLIGATAMAGAVGAGGLGDLALRYGYQQWDIEVMIITVVILVVLVQCIQSLGNWAARKLKKSA
jgi:D-methionine transport system permease protein